MGPAHQRCSATSGGVSGLSPEADLAVNVPGIGSSHALPHAADSLRVRCLPASAVSRAVWRFVASFLVVGSVHVSPLTVRFFLGRHPLFARGLWASAVCVSGGPPTSALGPRPVAPGPVLLLAPSCSLLVLGKGRGPCRPSRAAVLAASHKSKHSAHWSPRLWPPGRACCRGWRGAGRKSVGPRAPAAPRPSRTRPATPS